MRAARYIFIQSLYILLFKFNSFFEYLFKHIKLMHAHAAQEPPVWHPCFKLFFHLTLTLYGPFRTEMGLKTNKEHSSKSCHIHPVSGNKRCIITWRFCFCMKCLIIVFFMQSIMRNRKRKETNFYYLIVLEQWILTEKLLDVFLLLIQEPTRYT